MRSCMQKRKKDDGGRVLKIFKEGVWWNKDNI